VNKLFGYNTTNIFSIDNKGDDWYGLTNALKQIGLPYSGKQNKQMKNAYDTVFITIIYKELNKIIKSDNEGYKKDIVNEYNKYNIMRYGKSFEKYKTIQDIRKYWLKNKERKINIPDIKILLKSLENYNLDIDLGVLIVSFNGNGKNYIEFLHTENYYIDTDVILLQHVKYGDDYSLSNISKQGRLSLTIQELYDISDDHKKWIKEDKIKIKECPEKIKQDIQNKIEEKLREKEENNDEIDIEVDYLRNKLGKLNEGECE
jgi:polyhydroxyalkanoate synthesis regulator phasin